MLFFLNARCSHCLGLKLTHNTAMLKKSRELVPFFLSTFAGWLLLYLKLYKPTNTSNGITVPKYYRFHTAGTLYKMLACHGESSTWRRSISSSVIKNLFARGRM